MSSLLVIVCNDCGTGLTETERIIQDWREVFIKVIPCSNCLQKEREKTVDEEYANYLDDKYGKEQEEKQ